MRDELELIAESYLVAKAQTFANSPTAAFVRHDAALAVRDALGSDGTSLIVKGSSGSGRWSDSPWIAVMDPLVTATPQQGYYVTYLFAASMKRLVLSLQLGMTEYRNTLSATEAKERLKHLAALLRLRIPEFRDSGFSVDAIDLDSPGGTSRTDFYEAAHTFGTSYSFPLPSQEVLEDELRSMVRLYRLATYRGGFDADGPDDLPDADSSKVDLGIEDLRNYRLHRRVERNERLARAAKRAQGSTCQACGFGFEAVYGEIGRDYIEAHHLVPLSSLPKDGAVTLDPKKDFAVLCANCHRMIHRPGAPTDLAVFRKIVKRVSVPC